MFLLKNLRIEIDVIFPIYSIGLLHLFHGYLFALFGGNGLPASPVHFIFEFALRPRKLYPKELDNKKSLLLEKLKEIKVLVT